MLIINSLAHHIDRLSRNPASYLLLSIVFALMAGYSIVSVTSVFDQRTIGIAILYGQDPTVRNLVHVLGVLGGVCLFLSLFLRWRKAPATRTSSAQPETAGPVLGFLLLANLLFYFWYENPFFLSIVESPVCLIVLGLIIRLFWVDRAESCLTWMLAALTFQGITTIGTVFGFHLEFGFKYYCLFSLILALLLWVSRLVERSANTNINVLTLCHAFFPLMFAPLSIIAANEIQYAMGNRLQYSGSAFPVLFALFGLLTIWVFARFFRNSGVVGLTGNGCRREYAEWLLMARYIPVILATSVAYVEYTDTVNFFSASRDFFHGGEAIVPVQQILQFGSIPYIDFYPTHGLFDIFPQLFYQVVNQQDYVESIAWGNGYGLGWLPRMLAIVAMYWLLKVYLGYKNAFLILLFLPTYHMLHPYYVILCLPLFALRLETNTYRRWLVFWFLLVLVFLWRIDFGIASLPAFVFILAGWHWRERSAERLGRCFLAGVTVASIAALIFCWLAGSSGKSPVEVAQQILAYIQVQTPLSARQQIIKQVDFAALLQYILLPAIGALVAAHFLSLVLKREQVSRPAVILAFLAVASLVISARSLNRHSHFEGIFNPYFFTLVIALFPVVVFRFSRSVNTALFVVVCIGSYMFFPKSTSPFDAVFYRAELEQEYPYHATVRNPVKVVSGAPPATRLIGNSSGAENITHFLQGYLRDNETFYDFSNAPLLYALSGKRVPGFIMETFFQTSEDIQHNLIRDLNLLYGQDRLPIVLFRQLPASSGWNIPDGVHTAVRSYRIAEYLYRNYTPCANVDGYEVWLSNQRQPGTNCSHDLQIALAGKPFDISSPIKPVVESAQNFDLMLLPHVWANRDEIITSHNCSATRNVSITPFLSGSRGGYRLAFPRDVYTEGGNYLLLQLRTKKSGRATVTYADGSSFDFNLVATDKPEDYLIRVSSQRAWHQQEIDEMHLTSLDSMDLVCAAILPGD